MEEKRITLRLPEEVHAAIAELARQDVRSLNAEILVLLREAVAARLQAAQSAAREGQSNKFSPALIAA